MESDLVKEVNDFLNSQEGNKKLFQIMFNKGFLHGPLELSLESLHRCVGPEESMKFKHKKKDWKSRINKMIQSLENGWEPFPLILWLEYGKFVIADGSHRFEALKLNGRKNYKCVLWCKDKSQEKMFHEIINNKP